MNAPRDPGLSSALLQAELQADAAMHSDGIRQAAVRRARATLNAQHGRGGITAAVWRSISPELRQVLCTMATARRDVEAAAATPWAQLSDDERICIGSLARQWRRELEGAAWLR